MPIEIRELVIRAFVDAASEQKKGVFKRKKKALGNATQHSIDQLVEILKQERER